MPLRLVYVHGWGLNAEFWAPLRKTLGVMDDFAVDLGFTAPARTRIPYPSEPFIGVGHSLGLLWLLTQTPATNWQALISINGFSRFTKTDSFQSGWPERVVSRMISALESEPESVYMDFMTRAGSSSPTYHDARLPALRDGLEGLINWDGRPNLTAFNGPVLALAGGRDAIVSRAMTEACFNTSNIRVLAEGDHLLPLNATRWCATEIASFLESRV